MLYCHPRLIGQKHRVKDPISCTLSSATVIVKLPFSYVQREFDRHCINDRIAFWGLVQNKMKAKWFRALSPVSDVNLHDHGCASIGAAASLCRDGIQVAIPKSSDCQLQTPGNQPGSFLYQDLREKIYSSPFFFWMHLLNWSISRWGGGGDI